MSQPYAPTAYSSTASFSATTSLRSRIPLDEEARLYRTSAQRDLYESLAEIYAIIVTLDFVEKAYVKDTLPQAEYTAICNRLLAQYATILRSPQVAAEFGDLDTFRQAYDIEYPSAISRLRIGIPATVENPVASQPAHQSSFTQSAPSHTPMQSNSTGGSAAASARAAADATGNFITFMDALKLNYKAKDQLHPLLGELMTSLNAVTTRDFDGRAKIIEWLIKLNAMKATDEITDEQARQLLFDIDHAYKAFYKILE
ncbi:vacuolar protein sorting-associated [Limtongia smithiae]|uniref:vacuolar protein sorting-associated n=1 Tax=Limtongia smithiae TaxID=1125753 RepID=UPI0034CF78EE